MKRNLAIIMALMLLLTACGKNQGESAVQESHQMTGEMSEVTAEVQATEKEERNWKIEEEVLPDADEALADLIPEGEEIFSEDWFQVKETVYRTVVLVNSDDSAEDKEWFRGSFVQKLEAPYTEWTNTYIGVEDWLDGESCRPWNYGSYTDIITENGFAILLHGESGDYIGEWNEVTGVSVRKIESDIITYDIFKEQYERWGITQDGGYYFWGRDKYLRLNSDATVRDRIGEEEEYDIGWIAENSVTGDIYLAGAEEGNYDSTIGAVLYTGTKMASSDGKQTLVSSSEVQANSDCSACFVTETEGYVYSNFVLYDFSFQTGDIGIFYDFADDIEHYDMMYNENKPLKYMQIINGIVDGYAKEDDSQVLLVACGDGSYQIWKMSEEELDASAQNKEIVEWATTIPGSSEERIVAQFNQQSEQYKVVFRLPEEGEDFDNFRTRIQAEIAAGGGPDILSERSVMDMEDGAQRGFLLDITDTFADDEDDMLSSVRQLGMVEERRYAVPYSYTIITIVADKGLLKNYESWTLDDAMAYMKNSDADCFMADADTAALFYHLGLQTETDSRLIDWENNLCHLNSETAAELLEFAETYADQKEEYGYAYLRTANGEAATVLMELLGSMEMRAAAAMFHDDEVYIGFPTENGEGAHVLIGSNLMVNKNSSNQEGAIAFLEFLLSEETQRDLGDKAAQGWSSGFPVNESAMEQVYSSLQKEEKKDTGISIYGGLEFQEMPLTDESIAKLRELVESARPMGSKAAEVLGIVDEEIRNFRTEGKTIEQALDVIHSRVQLYMDEMKN